MTKKSPNQVLHVTAIRSASLRQANLAVNYYIYDLPKGRFAMTNQSEGKTHELALERCTDLITWYENQKRIQKILDNVLQTSVILAAGFTAFAAAVDSWPKWAIVLPAVITTVATGLSTNFRFRSKYVNFASAGERLKWAKLRFEIPSGSAPDDPKNLEAFVNSMEAIVSAELADWRKGLLAGDIAGKKADAP